MAREKAAAAACRQAKEQLREFQANLQVKIEGDTAREQALKTQILAERDQFKASVIAQAQEEVFRLKQELDAKSSGPMDTDLSESLRVEAQKNKDEIQRLLGQLDQETRAKNEVTQRAEAAAAASRHELSVREQKLWQDENVEVPRLRHAISLYANISSIKRCVNDHLWAPYAARREAMARRASGEEDRVWRSDLLPGVLNEAENPVCLPDANPCRERYLFHGAAPSTIDCILDENVDFRLSQITGAMGACAYFADQSSYSDQYCRMPDHSALVRHRHAGTAARPQDSLKMLVCRVLLGECGRGQPGLRRPPAIGGSGRLNDSVSNNPDTVDDCASQGSMYGVFDNAQVYPEYVVEYTRAGHPGHARANLATANAMLAALAGLSLIHI